MYVNKWAYKVKYLEVSLYFLQNILKNGEQCVRVTDGVPEDAKILRVEFPEKPYASPALLLVIESETFEELKPGDLIPKIESPIFEKIK